MTGADPGDSSAQGASDQPGRGAVALAYDAQRDRAPRVVASGYGGVAERIIQSARDHGVFVHDSPELVDLLMGLDLDEAIPRELYTVVAEILVWVAELEQAAEKTRYSESVESRRG